MTRIAVISDTHIPSRASAIPNWVRRRIQAADHTIHAGDFDSADAYETVHELADGDLTAVRGNTDSMFDLPLATSVDFDGVTFVVTHGTGDRRHYEERVTGIVTGQRRATRDENASGASREQRRSARSDEEANSAERRSADRSSGQSPREDGESREHDPTIIGVAGHTHQVLDTEVDGVRLLNPGSATGAAPADRATMMMVVTEDGVVDVTVHEQ